MKTNTYQRYLAHKELRKQSAFQMDGIFFFPPTVPSLNNFLMMLKLHGAAHWESLLEERIT